MCGSRGSLNGHDQATVHQPGSPGGVAKKLEEERKWRSKDPTKLGDRISNSDVKIKLLLG